jgi:DNA-binding response OmpR family regulator
LRQFERGTKQLRDFVKKKAKVLIMENDVPMAMQMVAALTQAGCDVKAACSGKKGMALATMKKFDLIVLDMGLLDMSSLEIYDDLKQRHISKHTPIVFISGKLSQEDRKRGLERGAVDCITKPFGVEFASRLLSHVRREQVASR